MEKLAFAKALYHLHYNHIIIIIIREFMNKNTQKMRRMQLHEQKNVQISENTSFRLHNKFMRLMRFPDLRWFFFHIGFFIINMQHDFQEEVKKWLTSTDDKPVENVYRIILDFVILFAIVMSSIW